MPPSYYFTDWLRRQLWKLIIENTSLEKFIKLSNRKYLFEVDKPLQKDFYKGKPIHTFRELAIFSCYLWRGARTI